MSLMMTIRFIKMAIKAFFKTGSRGINLSQYFVGKI